MKNRTAVAIVIMAVSFALSITFLFISLGFYALTGTKEVAERIYTGDWDELRERFDVIDVGDKSVRIDAKNLHIVVDDLGVDVEILGIKVKTRDEDEAKAREEAEKLKEEIKKLEAQKEEAEKKDAGEKAPEKRDHDGKGHGGHHDKKPAGQDS